VHERASAERLADVRELRDEPSRTLAGVDRELHIAKPRPALASLPAQRFEPAHAALVARAARLDSLADPRFFLRPELVELAIGGRLGGKLARLARLIRGEIAGIGAQQAAIELDDAGRHAIEECAVMRDHDRRARLGDQLLHQRDAVEVEVVGRLVEEQEVRCQRQREGQRRALLLPARCGLRGGCLVEPEAMQVFDEPRLRAPAVALVLNRFELAANREALAQRRGAGQLRLLFDQHDRESVARLHLPVVELTLARDDLQQRRLARAVPADEADALPFARDEVGAVEQRMEPERELGVLQGHERHGRRIVH
jgi:hypothetical protein